MLRVLILTNLFPNTEEQNRGNFVAQMVEELKKYAEITVISPLPWFPHYSFLKRFSRWYKYSKIPSLSSWNGIAVYYPKYIVIPRLFGFTHTATLALSAMRLFIRLKVEKKVDIINAHYVYPDGVAAVWIGKQIEIPVVVTAHGSDINLFAKYRFRRPQIAWALRNADRVTAVSNALIEKIVDNFGTDKKKIKLIPNGVDLKQFHLRDQAECRRKLKLDMKNKYLLYVGQLREIKGLEYLIESLALLQKRGDLLFDTLIVGDGPFRYKLQSLIADKKLTEKVIIMGIRPYSEIPMWMGASDLFCLPSKSEGQPCVILEALACGLPVVASKVGGIPELINNNNGILVSPKKSEKLANAIMKGFRNKWRKCSISTDIQNLTWANSAKEYSNLLSGVLCGSRTTT